MGGQQLRRFRHITAAIWVKQLTGSDAAAGMVFAALGLPALFAPLTGQLADHFPRRNLLVVNNAVAAGIVLLLFLVQSPDLLWLVYAVIFLAADHSRFPIHRRFPVHRRGVRAEHVPGLVPAESCYGQALNWA